MCQLSRFKENKVKETRKPMTVYKIVEVINHNHSLVRAYYQLNAIELDSTDKKCSLAEFRDNIHYLKMIRHVSIDGDEFGVREIYSEGIHAFPTLEIACKQLETHYIDATPGYTARILECEIPAWSGVIYGFDGMTLVTNRIKYVKLIRNHERA